MAKKGEIARQSVIDTIVEAFKQKDGFVCIQDKKIFVQAKESNENIQFAISITMPKTAAVPAGNDWSSPEVSSTELPAEDKAKVAELQKILGF